MPSLPLEGRVALVTGAGRRVGRTIALELARAGADLVVHHLSSRADAAETAARIEEMGRRALVVAADLTEPPEIEELVRQAGAAMARLDVLVNSAAAFERAPLEELTPERWDAMLDLNLRAPFLLSRAAVPLMRRNGGGVIVNIADVAGYRPWAHHLHYSVSKAALIAMTRCLALELAPDIRVNAVAPGTVLPAAVQTPEDLDTIRRRTPLGRLGTPEDVARTVLFLAAGPDVITGQVIFVDGGRAIHSAG